MGSGKDCACEYLIEKHGGTQVSFAAPIYDIMTYAQRRCGFPTEKDRKFLQFIGTEWGRDIEHDVWIRLAIEATPPPPENVFLSDLRFPNELLALQENGWVCVKLIRDHQETRKGSGTHTHSSEIALDDVEDSEWDHIIYNNGTLQDFYTSLDLLVSIINENQNDVSISTDTLQYGSMDTSRDACVENKSS